jgi:4-diphosphocytidyl-2-C-methyl-D-erythritol kinase
MQSWPAPAKLNLFLHITGQREDGYHLLQSAIQFIDLCDELSFSLRNDNEINCKNSNAEISPQDDLCVKAAKLLQKQIGLNLGIDIEVKNNIPIGAGLGGGSSDAATTLLALNKIWDCGLATQELENIAIQLGADVPVFVRGQASWVEGVGEKLSSITLEELWYVVVFPKVHLNTQQMFADPDLTRNCSPIRIRDFLQMKKGWMQDDKLADHKKTQNVFEPIARRQPAVERAFQWLEQYAPARLTGSGSGIFAACASRQQAEEIVASCAKEFSTYITKGINRSPVISLSEYNCS